MSGVNGPGEKERKSKSNQGTRDSYIRAQNQNLAVRTEIQHWDQAAESRN